MTLFAYERSKFSIVFGVGIGGRLALSSFRTGAMGSADGGCRGFEASADTYPTSGLSSRARREGSPPGPARLGRRKRARFPPTACGGFTRAPSPGPCTRMRAGMRPPGAAGLSFDLRADHAGDITCDLHAELRRLLTAQVVGRRGRDFCGALIRGAFIPG